MFTELLILKFTLLVFLYLSWSEMDLLAKVIAFAMEPWVDSSEDKMKAPSFRITSWVTADHQILGLSVPVRRRTQS